MTLEQACPSEYQRAQYAFKDSMTHWNSAIRITYRISLRSSSMPEPRDPLLKVFALIKNGTQTVNTVLSEFIGLATGGRGPEDVLRSPGSRETGPPKQHEFSKHGVGRSGLEDPNSLMILPQVHLRNVFRGLPFGTLNSIIAHDREHNSAPGLNLIMR
jgi:hypothetical protein